MISEQIHLEFVHLKSFFAFSEQLFYENRDLLNSPVRKRLGKSVIPPACKVAGCARASVVPRYSSLPKKRVRTRIRYSVSLTPAVS